MSLSAAVQTSLFNPKNGVATAGMVIKHRFISFLIWQSLLSTALLFLSKSFLLSPFKFRAPTLLSLLSFLCFHVSLISYSICLFILSSPQPGKAASPLDLLLGCARLIFISSSNNASFSVEARQAVKLSLRFMLFVIVSALSGFVLIGSMCWSCSAFAQTHPWGALVAILGLRGFIVGLFYGVYYVYNQRWVLQFPIIQRPLFFSFKIGVPSATKQALKLSAAAYLFSFVVLLFLHNEYKTRTTARNFIAQQIIFYIGNFVVLLCWELIHHLHQVLHTKRFAFAPPKGSAAAETNPSESLLTALEESTPHSLLQYLAYLDLCMVCERNVDTWRRAAFFEETGETYKRVVAVSLRPLELLTVKLGDGLESSSVERTFQLSDQLRSPTDMLMNKKLQELNYNFQLCAWCARIVASVTARSHKEDRFGVAQLSGSNTAVISTLLSALLAVETLMGKKTNLQYPYSGMSPAAIRWAPIAGTRDSTVGFSGRRRNSHPLYIKAYAMADILRTSIYLIVSAFYNEMHGSAKAGHLEKDWIGSAKVLYGTHELLSQKLRLFLEFRAC